jgi:hypothetical protein
LFFAENLFGMPGLVLQQLYHLDNDGSRRRIDAFESAHLRLLQHSHEEATSQVSGLPDGDEEK